MQSGPPKPDPLIGAVDQTGAVLDVGRTEEAVKGDGRGGERFLNAARGGGSHPAFILGILVSRRGSPRPVSWCRKMPAPSLAVASLLLAGGGGWLASGHVSAQVGMPQAADGSAVAGTPSGASRPGHGAAPVPPPSAATGGSAAAERTAGIDGAAMEKLLAARGFSEISNLRRRGGSYVCEATGPRRERVRLVLDAETGEISGLQLIGFAGKPY